MGDRHLVTVPQGVVGDRLPWGGERQGGEGVLWYRFMVQSPPPPPRVCGERPIGAAKGKKPDTEAFCRHPHPPPPGGGEPS